MTQVPKRVYLDVCALCRPFDDQRQMRIRLEADSVQLILSYVRADKLTLVVSPVHDAEIRATQNPPERQRLTSLSRRFGWRPEVDLARTRQRAEQLVERGLGPADAAHLAFALEAEAAFITCDDRLLRQCRHLRSEVWCGTPVAFCAEENLR